MLTREKIMEIYEKLENAKNGNDSHWIETLKKSLLKSFIDSALAVLDASPEIVKIVHNKIGCMEDEDIIFFLNTLEFFQVFNGNELKFLEDKLRKMRN